MRVLTAFLFIGTSVALIAKPDEILANSTDLDMGVDCPPVEYRPGGDRCDLTCSELPYEDEEVSCIQMCLTGYFCKKGYVREYRDGPCIPRYDCPESVNVPYLRNNAVELQTVERTVISVQLTCLLISTILP